MLLSDQTMEVVSSRLASFPFLSFSFPLPVFLASSASLFLLSSSLAAAPPPTHTHSPVPPRGPRVTLASDLGRGAEGRYRGPRGCRGRRPRAPAPLPRSSRARPALARTPAAAENDRRLGVCLQRLRVPQPWPRRGGALRGRRRSASPWAPRALGGCDARGAACRPRRPQQRCSFRVIISALEKIIRKTKRLSRQELSKAAPPPPFAHLLFGLFPPAHAQSPHK